MKNDSAEWREYPAQREHYEEMLNYILETGEQADLPMKRQMKLQLGFEEAVVNVISYAYEPGSGGLLWLRAYPEDGVLIIEIKDCGVKFDPLQKEDALAKRPASIEEVPIGGLGIAFMRRIFSDIAYEYVEEHGVSYNHLTLKFSMALEK